MWCPLKSDNHAHLPYPEGYRKAGLRSKEKVSLEVTFPKQARVLTRYLIQFLENLLVIPHSTVVPGSSSSTGSAFGIITRYIVVKLLSRVESFPHSNFVTGLSVASRFTESSRVESHLKF